MKCQMPSITFERNKYRRSYMGRLEMVVTEQDNEGQLHFMCLDMKDRFMLWAGTTHSAF